ncbi:BTE_collapsed_G0044380.mRNA.1.CDS.1 [Saccharomyces cerevisiae]|nr:BTE_collapsed_G0044380.mRNA.1.CDS.1 [Saccharomyces cerevisiae]
MLQYIPSQTYPTLTFHSIAHLSPSVPNALTSLCTALASAVYTLCHLPIKPIIIHILISISHSVGPKYRINALNTYVIPLFTPYTNHSIYTHLCQYYRKITTKIT